MANLSNRKLIGIYKITSPSGRIYIGQSIDIKSRFYWYRKMYCKTQVKLYKSFHKYGVDKHKFEIITECDFDQLNDMERYYQELYNTIKAGLNCGYVKTDVAKQVRSEEAKQKIGRYFKGRKRPPEICQRLSEARKGMKFSKEHCENIRKSKTGANNVCSKLVVDMSTGVFFYTITEAATTYGLDSRTLSKYLLGQRRNKTNLFFA